MVKAVDECVEEMICFGRGVEFPDLEVGASFQAECSGLDKNDQVC